MYPAAAVAHGLVSALISIDWSSHASDAALMRQLAEQFRLSPGGAMAAHLTNDQIFQSALALIDDSLSTEAKEAQASVGPWLADAAIAHVQQLLGDGGSPREG